MSQQSFPPKFDVSISDNPNTPTTYVYNSKVMMGAIIVLILVIFFILLLHVYAKWLLQRSRSRAISRGIAFVSLSATAPAHINTGLDKAAIAQLPTFVYKATSPVDNLEAGKVNEAPSLECAVCLSEFQDNEKGRMLPSCKHTFHTECIDMWLFSHSTCPLCRTKVVPAMANAPKTAAATQEQHQEGEAPEHSEGTPVVEYPYNVLFWGNQAQVEPSSSSSPLSQSSGMPNVRALPQITIDIPPIEGNLLVSTSEPVSAKCTTEEEAGSSQPLKSPGFRASFKRMLSRQSSRLKSFSQEGYEGSPK